MGLWSDRVVPHIADKALSTGDVMKMRNRAVVGLHGRVLEIGFGSGLNVGLYPDGVTEIGAVEPSDVGWRMSEERRSSSDVSDIDDRSSPSSIDLPSVVPHTKSHSEALMWSSTDVLRRKRWTLDGWSSSSRSVRTSTA